MSNETDKLLDLQIEVIQISIYCDIVKNLLLKHRSISVIKIISFSFIIKKRQHLQGSVYKGNNKVDLVLKFLSQACGLFDELCEQMPYIFQAIDLLVKDGFCETHEGELVCSLTSQQKAVDLDKSISFNKYLIQETTTRELKKQRDRIRQQILANKSRFAIYSVSEKEQAVTLIKEYLSYYDCDFDGGSLSEIRRELRKVREEIRILQNGNDTEKINSLSADITQLYKSSIEVSELAEYDFRKSGFHISYLKNGNILQPQILDEESDSADQIKNYYTGSMARHTLMQLCGYLGFLRMLIKEDKYPLIPFLVIDHISKPFDDKNQKALGAILHGAYTNLQKSEMQIILFDDEDASSLGLTPDHSINLLGEDKSGFNPFYMPSKEDSPNAPEEVE